MRGRKKGDADPLHSLKAKRKESLKKEWSVKYKPSTIQPESFADKAEQMMQTKGTYHQANERQVRVIDQTEVDSRAV